MKGKRQSRQLLKHLKRQQDPARVLYALLSLRLLSSHLSSDFYGMCYLCGLIRSQRSTLKKRILGPAEQRGFVSKVRNCRIETIAGTRELITVVMREYDSEERKRVKKPTPYDLPVLFDDGRALIPERWKKDLRLTLKPRSGYRFVQQRLEPTITALLTFGRACLVSADIAAWVRLNVRFVHRRLGLLMKNYRLDEKYGDRLSRLVSAGETSEIHSATFVGFALCDITNAGSCNTELL
jgi:hypothetical protein